MPQKNRQTESTSCWSNLRVRTTYGCWRTSDLEPCSEISFESTFNRGIHPRSSKRDCASPAKFQRMLQARKRGKSWDGHQLMLDSFPTSTASTISQTRTNLRGVLPRKRWPTYNSTGSRVESEYGGGI